MSGERTWPGSGCRARHGLHRPAGRARHDSGDSRPGGSGSHPSTGVHGGRGPRAPQSAGVLARPVGVVPAPSGVGRSPPPPCGPGPDGPPRQPDPPERLLRNLRANACRHARTEVTVTVNRSAAELVLTVHDDGPGIPPSDRARVFDRFTRLHEARTRRHRHLRSVRSTISDPYAAHRQSWCRRLLPRFPP
ncbi:sensor histidine kinase [Streptomyces omiyaensis]|uniref:histidine kinase n=1 Tax=Streptomyces omiyaensis TaxID=68247 RepID=A0ABW7BQ00_9ACTN